MRTGLASVSCLIAVAACSRLPPVPELEAVTPDELDSRFDNSLEIRGRHFHWRVERADFDAPRGSRCSARYQLQLVSSRASRALEEVTLVDARTLTARLPAGLSVGPYDLVVVDPWGRRDRLGDALEVIRDAQQSGRCEHDRDCIDEDACTTRERCDAGYCTVGPRDLDADHDGSVDALCGGDDCDDQERSTHPGAEESCDAVDSDCDGSLVDELPDLDLDLFPDCIDDDDDGDGVTDGGDVDPMDRFRCRDADADTCDDCSVTGGPPDPLDDGPDPDRDGQCGLPVFTPSNGVELAWLDAASTVFAPTADVVIDTDEGSIDGAPLGADFHVAGPGDCGGYPVELGVFAFTQVQIPPGVTVRVVGARALALGAWGTITIAGVIDATGGVGVVGCDQASCAGPGAFTGGRAWNPGDPGAGPGGGGGGDGAFFADDDETGGGGAGHGANGGRGGDDSVHPVAGGSGGSPYAGLEPLCGGSGGGGGGLGSGMPPDPPWGGSGGGGGGAVLLVSRVAIVIDGSGAGVNAGGGGGEVDGLETYDDGGGGGGSGGTILLEAPRVELAAGSVLAANGGGGGGGNIGGERSADGSAGRLDDQLTPAGQGAGRGGAGATPDGEAGMGQDDGTGGGGGAAGRIHVRTRTAELFVAAGLVSPAPSTGTLAP